MDSLDLFSTSQTNRKSKGKNHANKDRNIYDKCANNAPYFGYQIEGKKWGVVQGCCNDWNCPRCGQQRAREEYGRIVSGAREVGKTNTLYLFTITCRGREMSLHEAENGYLAWTNRLLTNLRTASKRANKAWFYAAVTERQERQHPHSHFITSYCPSDGVDLKKGEGKTYCTSGEIFPAKHDTIQSFSLEKACFGSGLGRQYDLSRLESVEAGSRYAAKYLFKASSFDEIWPKGWRRVRYSQNWPKLPEMKGDAIVLLSRLDWHRLSKLALIIKTPDNGVADRVRLEIGRADVIIQ